MDKARLNLAVDLLAGGLLTGMVATGIILQFILPPGSNRTHHLWSWSRHDWGSLHGTASLLLLGLLGVHVLLHGRWLVSGIAKRLGWSTRAEARPRTFATLLLLAAAAPLAAITISAALSVRRLDQPRHAQAAPAPSTSSPFSWSPVQSAAAQVLWQRCAACHGAIHTAARFRADGLDTLLASGLDQWVVPGQPDDSRLLKFLNRVASDAPAGRHDLSAGEWDALHAWITSLPRREAPEPP